MINIYESYLIIKLLTKINFNGSIFKFIHNFISIKI